MDKTEIQEALELTQHCLDSVELILNEALLELQRVQSAQNGLYWEFVDED